MALPLIPLIALGGGAYVGSAYLNARAMQSPDFIPRIGAMQSDARWWGIGAGVLGLLFAPAMPILGSLGLGAGLASLINWNTMDHVKRGVETFLSRQALAPAPAPFALPGPGMIPGMLEPLFAGEPAFAAPV